MDLLELLESQALESAPAPAQQEPLEPSEPPAAAVVPLPDPSEPPPLTIVNGWTKRVHSGRVLWTKQVHGQRLRSSKPAPSGTVDSACARARCGKAELRNRSVEHGGVKACVQLANIVAAKARVPMQIKDSMTMGAKFRNKLNKDFTHSIFKTIKKHFSKAKHQTHE